MRTKKNYGTDSNNGTHGDCSTTEHSVCSVIAVCSAISFSVIQFSLSVTHDDNLETQSPAAPRLA